MEQACVILKKGKEESLLRYHPWVFSGAVSRIDGEVQEGDLVTVVTSEGEFAARGHAQPGSIAVRVLTFADERIDREWWERRLRDAYALRAALSLADNPETTCWRLVHGEGDLLPGFVVDIYGSTAVIQAHSLGMYLNRELIAGALKDIFGGRLTAIYDKSGGTLPYNSGFRGEDGYLLGGGSPGIVAENGYRFRVNWERGQKTGFFLDQRDSRALVAGYSRGREVLNAFSYTGGFSVYALGGGASHVDSVDSSHRAVELAAENVELNFGKDAPHRSFGSDAFEFLKEAKGRYDLMILDPPAFAKHHRVAGNALQGYRRLNALAMSQIRPRGILFTFSCSQAVTREQFRGAVFSAAAISGRNVRILHQLTQPADHPVNIYHPEGEYLKGLVLYVE